MRKCGACSLCCVIPAIPELGKPADTPCVHLTASGCGIYESRPPVCREFVCNWLAGAGDVSVRPDRVGAYVTPRNAGDGFPDTKRGLTVRATAREPRRFERYASMRRTVAREVNAGGEVLVMAGETRRILTKKRVDMPIFDQDGRSVTVETI